MCRCRIRSRSAHISNASLIRHRVRHRCRGRTPGRGRADLPGPGRRRLCGQQTSFGLDPADESVSFRLVTVLEIYRLCEGRMVVRSSQPGRPIDTIYRLCEERMVVRSSQPGRPIDTIFAPGCLYNIQSILRQSNLIYWLCVGCMAVTGLHNGNTVHAAQWLHVVHVWQMVTAWLHVDSTVAKCWLHGCMLAT